MNSKRDLFHSFSNMEHVNSVKVRWTLYSRLYRWVPLNSNKHYKVKSPSSLFQIKCADKCMRDTIDDFQKTWKKRWFPFIRVRIKRDSPIHIHCRFCSDSAGWTQCMRFRSPGCLFVQHSAISAIKCDANWSQASGGDFWFLLLAPPQPKSWFCSILQKHQKGEISLERWQKLIVPLTSILDPDWTKTPEHSEYRGILTILATMRRTFWVRAFLGRYMPPVFIFHHQYNGFLWQGTHQVNFSTH